MEYKSNARKIFLLFDILILTLLSLTCILPFINLLAVSFSGSAAVAGGVYLFCR